MNHLCGLQGYDPMKGDHCPACDRSMNDLAERLHEVTERAKRAAESLTSLPDSVAAAGTAAVRLGWLIFQDDDTKIVPLFEWCWTHGVMWSWCPGPGQECRHGYLYDDHDDRH